MDFSNRHTNKFVYACDLERVLGGVFACHEGVGNSVNVEYKGITKRFTPRPILGEGRVRVHSDFVGVETPTYKNICHPELVSGSYQRCISPFNENTFLRPNYTLKAGKMLKQVQHDSMGITTHCISDGGVK